MDKAKFIGALALYKLLVDIFYIFCLTPDYWGKKYALSITYPVSWATFVIIIGLFVLFAFKTDRLKSSISQQIMILLMLMSVLPVMSFFGGGGITAKVFFYYIIFCVWLLTVLAYISGISNNTNVVKLSAPVKRVIFFTVCSGAIIAIVFTFFYYLGGNFFVDGLEVYGQRALFAKLQSSMPRALIYVLSVSNIVEIFLILYCLSWKKYKYIPFLLIVWYMHFSLAGEKTVLFSIIFALSIYFIAKKITLFRIVAVGNCIILLSSLSVLLKKFDYVDFVWTSNLLRRAMFVPILLQEQYVAFFSDKTPSYWGINPEYSIGQGLENLISDLYYGSSLGHANNGILGDCFVNMGEYGIILYPIVFAIILKAFDWAASGKDARLFFGVTILFVTYVINGMLTTVMVSHGGLVMMLLLWLFPENSEPEGDRKT